MPGSSTTPGQTCTRDVTRPPMLPSMIMTMSAPETFAPDNRPYRIVRWSCHQPRNRAVVNVVAPGNLPHGLAVLLAAKNFLPLVRGELVRSAHFHTARASPRSRPSLVRARIRSRSNSARPPSTVTISRPCDVVK